MSWDGRTAVVATTLGDEKLLLYAMTARETLGRPFVYELDLLSEDEKIDLSKLLGQPIQVALQLADFSYREFNGIVTHFSLSGELGRYVRYHAMVRPWFWLLSQGRNSRVFKNKTVPTIVKEIFREHGFSDFSESLTSDSYRTWEYLIQYNESDFNFISRILEQEGIYYFFKHHDGKHTLVLCDAPSSHDKIPGYEEVPYYPPHHKERRERDHIDSWFATRQIRPGTYTSRDYNFTAPTKPMHVTVEHPEEHAQSHYEFYEYPGEFVVSAEGETQANVRLEELQVDHDSVRGKGNVRGLTTGGIFKLENFPGDDQNKDYLLTELSYIVRVSGYESGRQEGEPPDYSVTFSAIDARRQYRPPRITPKPRVEGPQTAKVVGQKGEEAAEIATDNYGRVHILFHWDRLNAEAGEPSCTVRVAQLWAGTGFGGIHIPRIDQEVIVEFLEGDPDRPIVTGRVYNENNMPPYTLPDNKTQSGIKSRSVTKGTDSNFNELRFEDKKGEEELHIQAEKNMTTLVKNDQSTTVQNNRSAGITASDSVSVGGDRSLSVNGARTVTVTKSNTETYKDTRAVRVTGTNTFNVIGAHTGIYENTRTLTIKGPDKVTVQSVGKTDDVTGKFEQKASSEYVANQGENQLLLTGAQAKLKNSQCSVDLSGGKVTITAPEGIELKVGSNTISIKNDGTISVTASATASLSAGGKSSAILDTGGAQVSGPMVTVSGEGSVEVMGAVIKLN
ncbi:MAG: type VI secretion system Vgr family protein [Myxococcota bacterium]